MAPRVAATVKRGAGMFGDRGADVFESSGSSCAASCLTSGSADRSPSADWLGQSECSRLVEFFAMVSR